METIKNVLVGQSGGPTAVINASLAGVYETARAMGAEHVYGMRYGIQGLLQEQIVDLNECLSDKMDIELLKRTPASYLGSCRFRLPNPDVDEEPYKQLFHLFEKYEIGAVFYIGGNDSMDTIARLAAYGAKVKSSIRFIGVPKTIDNDIYGTDVTFGFQSAINIATEAIDCIHTTAASHNRVFIVEVMGHKVGWLTLYAGIAGGADIILLPEIPYDINKVIGAINKRTKAGKGFTILAVAEGAISKEDSSLTKKAYKAKVADRKYPSVSYEIADQIYEAAGVEVRVTVPGHTQRGGSPCPYDRVLCTRLGSAAAQAIIEEDYGYMIAMINGETKRVPLAEVSGKLKTVDPDCQMIQEAKRIGISFGD